jgi:hypothetical protein
VFNCGAFNGTTYTETGRVTSDPKLSSPPTGDFTIPSDSGAKDAGVDLAALFTTDKGGTTRSAPWDIGAYENGGGTANLWSITASLDCGSVHKTGSAAAQNIVITNSGTAGGGWIATSVPTGFALSSSSGWVNTIGSETITCTATPPSDQTYSGNVVFDFSDSVSVTVTGTNYPARLASNPTSWNAGPVAKNTATVRSIELSNVGEVPAAWSASASGGVWTGSGSGTISPGSTGTFNATFTPVAVGISTGSYTVTGGGDLIIASEGTGTDTTDPFSRVVGRPRGFGSSQMWP